MYLVVTLNVASGEQLYALFAQKSSIADDFSYSLYFMWIQTLQTERNRMQRGAVGLVTYVT